MKMMLLKKLGDGRINIINIFVSKFAFVFLS